MTIEALLDDMQHFQTRWAEIVEAYEDGDGDGLGTLLIDSGEDFDALVDELVRDGITT